MAIVFIWPLMSPAAQRDQEVECVHAGYKNKQFLTISGHDITVVT